MILNHSSGVQLSPIPPNYCCYLLLFVAYCP